MLSDNAPNNDRHESIKCTPAYWFLDERESAYLNARSKRWAQDYGIAGAFTTGNLVTPLIDGAAYMRDLYESVWDMKAGDYLYMIGWQFTPDQYLLDPNDDFRPPALAELLRDLIGRGVDIRVMAFWPPTPMVKFFTEVSSKTPHHKNDTFVNGISGAGGKAVLDSRLPKARVIPRSHHQKALVLCKGDRYIAYLGGIDLANDRWDTPRHVRAHKDSKFYGWHDIQCRVEGDAVQQIWANFADRWNDHPDSPDQVPPATKPPEGAVPGSHTVQVLRTYGAKPEGALYSFMPYGEQTIHQAFIKAIRKAEHYIYIEEQFPFLCDIAVEINRRLRQVPNLKVILVMPHGTDIPGPIGGWHSLYLRRRFLETLTGGINYGDASRVYPYFLWKDPASLPADEKLRNALDVQEEARLAAEEAQEQARLAAEDAEEQARLAAEEGMQDALDVEQVELAVAQELEASDPDSGFQDALDEDDEARLAAMEGMQDALDESKPKDIKDIRSKIYVHSKLLLIDDRYVAIGSANINNRSMTSDSELQIAIVDEETVNGVLSGKKGEVKVCRFAQTLRRELWAEHLGQESPADLEAALQVWPFWHAGSTEQVHHVRVLVPEKGKRFKLRTLVRNFDPFTPEWKAEEGS